jgi:hypothetical protein
MIRNFVYNVSLLAKRLVVYDIDCVHVQVVFSRVLNWARVAEMFAYMSVSLFYWVSLCRFIRLMVLFSLCGRRTICNRQHSTGHILHSPPRAAILGPDSFDMFSRHFVGLCIL